MEKNCVDCFWYKRGYYCATNCSIDNSKFKPNYELLQAENEKLREQVRDLVDACESFSSLLVCYRVGKSPSNKLFKQLEKARETLSKYKAGTKT